MFQNLRNMLVPVSKQKGMPNLAAPKMPHMPKAASGMPTHAQLNAVSPGMHVPKNESPITIPESTYKPEVLGDTMEHKYQKLQRMLRNE